MMNNTIYIAGHKGMVGSAIWRLLKSKNYDVIGKSSKEMDLKNYDKVFDFLKKTRPSFVIISAAKVGGIVANKERPYSFIMENLLIQNNLIRASYELGLENLIFLGSSCIYPKNSKQPIKEDYLLNGPLEETNESYAVAKIAGIKLIESIRKESNLNYFSLMPCNLYGPRDNFDYESSHVIPGLLRKFHDAKINGYSSLNLWGTGEPLREFLHVNDLADAIYFCIKNRIQHSVINVGSGNEISIKKLANMIKKITHFKGEILWDKTKPDGTYRKLLDNSRVNSLGWDSKIDLNEGLNHTYKWFIDNYDTLKINKM